MKIKLTLFLCFFLGSSICFAESYTCSYPGYFGGKLVMTKIKLTKKDAFVDKFKYRIAENTPLGIVLVRSFAEYNKFTKSDDLGLFGITINKKNMKYTRGNILNSSKENSIATGRCLKD